MLEGKHESGLGGRSSSYDAIEVKKREETEKCDRQAEFTTAEEKCQGERCWALRLGVKTTFEILILVSPGATVTCLECFVDLHNIINYTVHASPQTFPGWV